MPPLDTDTFKSRIPKRAREDERNATRTLLLAAAKSINEDLQAASQEHVDALKKFLATFLNLPRGEEVRLANYKKSLWHILAEEGNVESKEALQRVLREPLDCDNKIVFYTRRADHLLPKFPRLTFKWRDQSMTWLFVFDVTTALDKERETLVCVSFRDLVGSLLYQQSL